MTVVVHHGAHLSQHRTSGDDVAGLEGAVLHQQRGHGAFGFVEVGLDHGAAGQTIRVGLQVFHFGDQQQHLQQLVDVFALDGAHRHHHHIAAPVFRQQVLLRQLLLHPLGR